MHKKLLLFLGLLIGGCHGAEAFIIFGTRGITGIEATVQLRCTFCNSTPLNLCSMRDWFTLYFVPIIPVNNKKYYIECPACKNGFLLKADADIEEYIKECNKSCAQPTH